MPGESRRRTCTRRGDEEKENNDNTPGRTKISENMQKGVSDISGSSRTNPTHHSSPFHAGFHPLSRVAKEPDQHPSRPPAPKPTPTKKKKKKKKKRIDHPIHTMSVTCLNLVPTPPHPNRLPTTRLRRQYIPFSFLPTGGRP